MTEKEFDRKIGERLNGYEERPVHDVYSRIEKTLARNGMAGVKPRKKILIPLYRYVSAAAVISLAVLAGIYFTRRAATVIMPENTVAEATKIFSEPESGITPTASDRVQSFAEAVRQDVVFSHTKPAPQRTEIAQTSETVQEEFAAVENSAATGSSDNSDELPQIYRRDRSSEQPILSDNRYMAQAAGTDSRRTSTSRQRISGSVYAGNFGAGRGDLSTREQDKVASANMLIKQTFDEALPCASGLNTEEGFMMPVAENLNTQEAVLNHRMPITAGLSLAFTLNDRMSLTTGLNYSYLYSSSSQNFISGSSNITRELHYLGIPVGLSYTLLRNGSFSLYAQGGGMIEKAVLWRETYGISTSLDHNTEKASYHVKGVQLSVNISAGASYYFSRNLGLYVEPGISYYFPQRYQPANYRTVHPVSFSLRAGIRFGK